MTLLLYKTVIIWLLIKAAKAKYIYIYCQGFIHANASLAHTRISMIFMPLALMQNISGIAYS